MCEVVLSLLLNDIDYITIWNTEQCLEDTESLPIHDTDAAIGVLLVSVASETLNECIFKGSI